MPSFKDKNNKWYCKFYYVDSQGENKQKLKRGFEFKRDADKWEREFLTDLKEEDQALTLKWSDFCHLYLKHNLQTISEHTAQNKHYTFKNHVFNAFNKPINEIQPKDIEQYINSIVNDYSLRHVKNIYANIKTVFNFAVRMYGLNPNPILRVNAPYKREFKKEMLFWTLEEYNQVIANVFDIKAKTAITLLYWSGIRKGELLALLWSDVDLKAKTLDVSKSYQRLNGEAVITPPKNQSSIRNILLPDQAIQQLKEWKKTSPSTADHDYIFDWEKEFIENGIKQGCELSGVKRIRVHDLRHSHASYLISHNANIKLVSKRLGHAKTSMTLDTYSHLFPTDEYKIIDIMNQDK